MEVDRVLKPIHRQRLDLDHHRKTLLEAYLDSYSIGLGGRVTSSSIARQTLIHLEELDGRNPAYSGLLAALKKEFTNFNGLLVLQEEVKYKRFSYDPMARLATTPYPEHHQVQLLPIQGRLFHILLANGGRIVTNSRLVDFAWQGEDLDFNLLKSHISRLRSRIGDSAQLVNGTQNHKHIRRLYGGPGYGFYDDLATSSA